MPAYETISGIKHPAYRDALALLKASGRTESRRFLAEDSDMARQALKANIADAVYALPADAPAFFDECTAAGVPLYVLPPSLMQRLIGTGYETAVTVLTVARQRETALLDLLANSDSLILCAENIQDPRNVGVLIRTAESVGCSGLLLSGDSADPWSRQSVRSTTGSVFRLPVVVSSNLIADLALLRARGARIVASSARGAELVYDADLAARPLILCVGNETRGITPELRAVSDGFVKLPMAPNGASSLNVTVAAGALLYEAVRQNIVHRVEPDTVTVT